LIIGIEFIERCVVPTANSILTQDVTLIIVEAELLAIPDNSVLVRFLGVIVVIGKILHSQPVTNLAVMAKVRLVCLSFNRSKSIL
jgi:hypothetical protein